MIRDGARQCYEKHKRDFIDGFKFTDTDIIPGTYLKGIKYDFARKTPGQYTMTHSHIVYSACQHKIYAERYQELCYSACGRYTKTAKEGY